VDVAFLVKPKSGKLTFARNADGDFYFDTKAIYPVFSTLFSKKGMYFWDATLGTYLWQINKDFRSTATRVTANADDALKQVKDESLLSSFINSTADRIQLAKSGIAWQINLQWKTPAGEIRQKLMA